MCTWYSFTTTAGADPTDPANYSLLSAKPTCPGTAKICAICAQDDGFGHPVITCGILADMVITIQFGVDQSLVILRI